MGLTDNDSMQKQKTAILALATLPAHEIIRTPITFLLGATAACGTLITPLVLAFQFGDTGRRLVRDGGLGLQLTIGIILAAVCACNLIRRERESGVTAMLLTKPVARHWYLLSRFAGITAVILLFSAIATPATLLAHRAAEAFDPETGHRTDYMAALSGLLCIPLACATAAWRNWRRNNSFHAVAILALPIYLCLACLLAGFYNRAGELAASYNPQLDLRIVAAAACIAILLMVFTALALTLSTLLPPVSTAAVCLMVLFGGLLTPLLLIKQTIWRPLFATLPNWNWFWLANQLDAGTGGIARGFTFAALYGLLLMTATLAIGMIIMEKMEVPT